MAKRVIWSALAQIAPLLAFILVWEFWIASTERGQFFFASPSLVAKRLFLDIMSGELLWHIGITGAEAACGFFLGNLVGISIGLSLWLVPPLARVVQPYIVALASVPVFAVAPMTVIWFGVGFYAKVMLAGISTVFVAMLQSYVGARNVDPDLIGLMRSFGATKMQIYKKVVVPSALVWVVASLRMNVGFALLGAFIGEFISSSSGLGHYVLRASGLFDVPQVLSGVLGIIFLAVVFNYCVALAERRLLWWRMSES